MIVASPTLEKIRFIKIMLPPLMMSSGNGGVQDESIYKKSIMWQCIDDIASTLKGVPNVLFFIFMFFIYCTSRVYPLYCSTKFALTVFHIFSMIYPEKEIDKFLKIMLPGGDGAACIWEGVPNGPASYVHLIYFFSQYLLCDVKQVKPVNVQVANFHNHSTLK